MYGKEESAAIRKEFWTVFGQYMSHQRSAEGLKVNWINYRTGIKDIYFRSDITRKEAYIGIELHHNDDGIRELFFEQFLELKTYLHSVLDEEWHWEKQIYNDAEKVISSISTSTIGYSIYNKEHWPELIRFLKPRIIKLDEFWADAKYSFNALL